MDRPRLNQLREPSLCTVCRSTSFPLVLIAQPQLYTFSLNDLFTLLTNACLSR